MGYNLIRSGVNISEIRDISIVNGEFCGKAYDEGLLFRFNQASFPVALELADEYGWLPEGTHAPRFDVRTNSPIEGDEYLRADTEWRRTFDTIQKSYLPNARQVVTAADAQGIAVALEKSLIDIPDEFVFPIDRHCEAAVAKAMNAGDWATAELLSVNLRTLPFDAPALDFFSGRRPKIVKFIRFCRGGEFVID